ncbi:MAG: sugar nucleotide-binding protein [Rhodoferax sp.]|nr:sugar nucleotide-binding protein [Rhodoferax sp.]
MHRTVLILGARGRFGWAAAQAFAAAGWRVVAQVRPGRAGRQTPRVEWLGVDPTDVPELLRAVPRAAVVVHALNPPYVEAAWRTQAAAFLTAAIRISQALGARLMMPGNVYNFGIGMPPELSEDTPQCAHTPMGRVRVALEAQLAASGVPAVVVRAGDFFGSGQGSWFDRMLVRDLRRGRVSWPSESGTATPWAYLPDLARTFVELAQREQDLPRFEVLHFAGHQLAREQWREVLTGVAREQAWLAPGDRLSERSLPWGLLRAVAPVSPPLRALTRMHYLHQRPHALVNARLVDRLGAEPHTPLRLAVRHALADLGWLKETPERLSASASRVSA